MPNQYLEEMDECGALGMIESETSRLGLQLDLGVKLSGDWKGLASDLATSAGEFFLKGPLDAASGALSGLIKFVTSIHMNPSVGYRAWNLSVISFAWAVDQLSMEIDKELAVEIIRRSVETSRKDAEKSGIFVPIDFINRPTNFFLYKNMRDEFVKSSYKDLDHRSKSNLLHKIDSCFSRAIFDILSKRAEYFKPIVEALNVPGADSAEMSLAWTAYRSKLSYDFKVKPLFGQEDSNISLSQLYVPLRGVWKSERLDKEIFQDLSINEHNSNLVIIDDYLYDWSFENDAKDWLRLLGGGPGSGKSTTLKSLASRLAENDGIRPLFIPLQHIEMEKDLRESVNSYFVDSTDGAFTQPPLSRTSVEDGPPLILIFDGLDELVAPGEAAKDVVGTFANRLNSLVSALSGSGGRVVKAVVSGRMPAFQAAARFMTPPAHGALEAYGFLPLLSDRKNAKSLWGLDQRPIWWRQYAKLKGQDEALPEALSNEQLSGITHEPLLCYLLVLAGYATEHWELAADNRNRIYAALIDSVYERGWGDGTAKRLGPGRTLSRQDFSKLMETIALAAWLGGDARVASEQKFEEAVEITDARHAWSSFCEDNGDDVNNLAMNFYLKASEKSQRGFEFTHKSFGEYLCSRALLQIAKEVSDQSVKRPDYALQDWYKATRTGSLTFETLSFLRDELRLEASTKSSPIIEGIRRLKSQFETLAKKANLEGFPIVSSGLPWRAIEIEQANAECAIWGIINSCSRALYEYGDIKSCVVDLKWEHDSELSDIIRRLDRFDSSSIIYKCLNFVNADGQSVSSIIAHGADFEGMSLKNSLISSSGFFNSSFKSVNFENCRFYESRIERSDFSGAEFNETIFHASKIKNCIFYRLSGESIVLSPFTLALSSPNTSGDIGGILKILITDEGSLERAMDSISHSLEILPRLAQFERDGLVEDID